ncbi:MAG: outer membrane protein assembly factor BamA, partial [Treponemataceae bacterium]|nr:outer membrane protein assembly factor BamA [Treponemataceae bacterium]
SKSKLSLKEEGFMKSGAFQRSSLEADKQAIVAYYMTRGYIDARIVDVLQESVVNEKKDHDELTLTFIIQEGAQYTYNGITITGNEIFSTEKLLSFIKLKTGDVFNQTKFMEGVSGITNLYYENGYMSNEFYPNVSKDAERRTVAYSLQIVEHSRAHIENIIIKGNTKTKDYVILRELPFQPGDIFSRDKIMSGIRNLYNTQYFSSIVPEPVSGSEENLVDLVISVEEQSTTSLQFGMTFSGIEDPDDLPISLFAKWQNSNLKGLGKTISAGVSISSSNQAVDFSYGQSWLFDKPIQLSESLTFYHADDSALAMNWLPDGRLDDDYYYMNFQSWGVTLGSSLGHRWLPNFAIVTLSGGMTNTVADNIYDEALYAPLDSGVNKYANRLGMKNSLYAAVSLDNRDISYDPSRGWFFNERVAWYGLIPGLEREFYFRTDTKLEAYLKLFDIPIANGFWNFKAVLAAMTSYTAIFPVPGTLFGYSSKVYVDGMFNGRGWTDIYNEVRGKTMLSNSIELRIPIFQGILGIDGFFDAVVVKDEPEQLFNALSVEDFYFSFGPGLRFLIPQFPLHLLFANKFRIRDGEVKWDDTWQFVLSFNVTNR